MQGLCSVVVWNSPEVSCGGISGFDVRLYSPQSVHRNVTRRVGANGTYYIIKDEDNLAGSDETYVQVNHCMILALVCYYYSNNCQFRFESFTIVERGNGAREFH